MCWCSVAAAGCNTWIGLGHSEWCHLTDCIPGSAVCWNSSGGSQLKKMTRTECIQQPENQSSWVTLCKLRHCSECDLAKETNLLLSVLKARLPLIMIKGSNATEQIFKSYYIDSGKMLFWLFPYSIAVEIPSLQTARSCCPQLYSTLDMWTMSTFLPGWDPQTAGQSWWSQCLISSLLPAQAFISSCWMGLSFNSSFQLTKIVFKG